ncbi:MAG: TetR family transcriptional regulator [Alphaproteobacteria bacterium]
MAKKQQKDAKVKLIESAMNIAAKQGWGHLTLAALASANKMTLAELHEYFEDKQDILTALGRMIDRQVLAAGEGDEDSSPRDRLFDLLMERYEALNAYRPGLVSVLESFKFDPKQAVIGLPHLCKSMNWMLEAAGQDSNGWGGALRLAGLTGLYIKNLKVWAGDDSADLAKVMASLDKDLGRAESLAKSIGL